MELQAPPQVLWDRHHHFPDTGTLENAEGEAGLLGGTLSPVHAS